MVEGTRLYLKCSFFCYNGCGDFNGSYVKDETKIKIKKNHRSI